MDVINKSFLIDIDINYIMKVEIPNIKLNNDVEMPVIGLGTWQLTGKTCERAVRDAILLGYTHIDTADFYGNHKEIAKAIHGTDRKKLFITTKVWYDNLKYDNVLSSCKRALEELETNYIDLYLIHWPNKSIHFKETFEALKKLYDEGKVRAIGVSNFTVGHLEEAKRVCSIPISVNQVEFHPYLNQKELLSYCKKNGIVVTAYSPLSRGKVNDDKTIIDVAKKYNKTPGQTTLRWMIDKNIIVIPKASSFEHLKENLNVFDFKLKKEDAALIDGLNKNSRMINPDFAEFFLSIGYNIKKVFKK